MVRFWIALPTHGDKPRYPMKQGPGARILPLH